MAIDFTLLTWNKIYPLISVLPIEYGSLIPKTDFTSLWRGWKMHFWCPFNRPKTAKTVDIMECLEMDLGGQADHLGWPPPPLKRSGKCEIFWLWFFIYDIKQIKKKKKNYYRKFLWRHSMISTVLAVLGQLKRYLKYIKNTFFSLFTMK